jgi:hypothetical protein
MPMPLSHTCSSSLVALRALAQAAADEHTAVVGVADGVADQVAQHAFQQHRVGLRHVLLAPEAEHQALFEGRWARSAGAAARRVRAAHRRGVHVDATGVDARDVEQFAEQAFERVDRFVDAVHQRRHLGVVAALAQRLGEQAHGVQRLAQVVAGGGEELRLGAVGGFGGTAAFVGHAPRLVGPTSAQIATPVRR